MADWIFQIRDRNSLRRRVHMHDLCSSIVAQTSNPPADRRVRPRRSPASVEQLHAHTARTACSMHRIVRARAVTKCNY